MYNPTIICPPAPLVFFVCGDCGGEIYENQYYYSDGHDTLCSCCAAGIDEEELYQHGFEQHAAGEESEGIIYDENRVY